MSGTVRIIVTSYSELTNNKIYTNFIIFKIQLIINNKTSLKFKNILKSVV